MNQPYDLILRGGTLIDPMQGLHARRDIAFAAGRVAAVAESLANAEATESIDVSDLLVAPGLIDLHVHVFEGVSHYGIPPDPTCLARGVTTAVDAGSAGADTFDGFRKYVIEASATRLLAQLNISSQGMLSPVIGELDELKWADVGRALQTVERHRDVILGIKVRLTRGQVVGEGVGMAPLYRAREAADAAGLPIMVHPQGAYCASLDDILAEMKAGDILTHSFHGREHGILDEDGQVRKAVREARERGVLFDVGHGAGSFSWRVAETALAGDSDRHFAPDTISSDLHIANVNGPVFDLATTVSKFLHLGMPLDEALRRVTSVPAQIIGMANEIGTLVVGACGDAVVLELETGKFRLTDCQGEMRMGRQRLTPRLVVRAGRLYREGATPYHHHHHSH
jgi:dihydroorotase